MGDIDSGPLGSVESTLKYHPDESEGLTATRYPGPEHCLVGSLTGAVTSERVTEARKGSLRLIGNQPKSVKA